MRARKSIAFDRLLARLTVAAYDKWLLKGGFSLQLRLADRARSTKDIDLAWLGDQELVHDALLDATRIDVGDFFSFRIERASTSADRLRGSHRFRATAELAGRVFERLVVDCGFDNSIEDGADRLAADDLLGFAGIPPTEVRALPLERHIAEKLHAYSRVHEAGRLNTRVKDLVDMALIAQAFTLDAIQLGRSVATTFERRAEQPAPSSVPPPPEEWALAYSKLAAEVGLAPELADGLRLASALLNPILTEDVRDARWNPSELNWIPN